MRKLTVIVIVLASVAFGVGRLPLGTECAACNRATTFNNGVDVELPGATQTATSIATFHRRCYETPKKLEDEVRALKDALRTDMSRNNADAIYAQLEATSLRIIRIKQLSEECAQSQNCDAYDSEMADVFD